MARVASALAFLAFFMLFSSTMTRAINITRALDRYSQFSTMNELFTKTGLTTAINKRNTITLLAVENGAISAISGRPNEEIKNILMNHVVLDYYDEFKLGGLKGKSSLLTTLFQTTGLGQEQNGFVRVSKTKNGKIVFGSGVKKSPLIAEYVKTVFHNPYNLSIIQVSMPIVAPGLGDPLEAPPPPPFTPPPAEAPEKAGPAEAPGPAEEAVAEAPGPASGMGPAPEPSGAPAPAPGKGKKQIPAADESEPASGGASIAGLNLVAAAIGLVAGFVAL